MSKLVLIVFLVSVCVLSLPDIVNCKKYSDDFVQIGWNRIKRDIFRESPSAPQKYVGVPPGIDTPESRTRNLEEKARGLISKQYMVDKCPVGSNITLHSLDRGKFGRILGEIWEDGIDATSIEPLNKRMCQKGLL